MGIEQEDCCHISPWSGKSFVSSKVIRSISQHRSFYPGRSVAACKMQLLACLSLTLSVVSAFPTAENFAKLSPSIAEVQDLVGRLQHEKRLVADPSGKPIDGALNSSN